jgi:DNA-binding GntR family transcriptional regulator
MAGNLISAADENPDSHKVAQQLRLEILSGRLADGLRVTEADLSRRFGVGRGQAREAVQKLTAQGLLQSRPNCGAVVAPEAPLPIRRLIVPIRRSIEAYALETIFDDLNETDFRRWEDNLAQMRTACETRDHHAITELDIAFHRQLLDRAGQADLLLIWETLIGRIRSHFRRKQRRCSDTMEIYAEHRALVDTFRNGILADAVKLLKEKID